MKKLVLIVLIVIGLAGLLWWQQDRIPLVKKLFHKSEEMSATKYMCPMHHQIIRDKPGVCPICGMTLVPISAEETGHQHAHPEGSFLLQPERRQAIGVQLAEIRAKDLKQEVRLPGRVALDKELYTTENEYVSALRLKSDDLIPIIETKMTRLGISDEELQQLKQKREADESLFLPKPDGPFWIYASIYEGDFFWVAKGMTAQIVFPANPGVSFEGIVQQVTPIVDSVTRTATARIRVTKSANPIKPETYFDVVLKKDLGSTLAIPADAVIDTGTRQIVFVDLGDGYLEPREVTLGTLAGNDYPVVKGLSDGEKIVTTAHFLLDSESQIQAAIKMFGSHRH